VLEVFSFYLIVNYNHTQREIFLNSSNRFTSFFLEISGSVKGYFSLKKANDDLSRQNAYLRSLLPEPALMSDDLMLINDLFDSVNYVYHPARVINNSVNKTNNYITINQGSASGIKIGTGVISARGIVGIVSNVSTHYSVVISLLNSKFKVSAKLRNSEYFGSLSWDYNSYQHALLSEIPSHVLLQKGDAIVTSGYSAIFPENILIGIIEDFELSKGEGFYNIKVKLSVDFKNITYVETVEKTTASEQYELEKESSNDK
jgi:rod shape-determining protein MreC